MMNSTEENRAFIVATENAKNRGIFFDAFAVLKVLVALIVGIVFAFLGESGWAYRYAYYLGGGIVMILLSFLFCRYTHLSVRETCRLKMPKAKFWLYALLLFAGMTFGLSNLNGYFIDFLEKYAGYKYQEMTLPAFSVFNYAAVVFTVCLVPAFTEELVFRGVISSGLIGGGIFAAIINGFVFAIYHASPAQTIYQFIVGFSFAILAEKSRSVFPTAAIHFFNNLFVVTVYYAFGGEINFGTAGNVIASVFGVICMVAFYFVSLRRGGTERGSASAKWLITSSFLRYAIVGVIIYAVLWIMSLLNL